MRRTRNARDNSETHCTHFNDFVVCLNHYLSKRSCCTCFCCMWTCLCSCMSHTRPKHTSPKRTMPESAHTGQVFRDFRLKRVWACMVTSVCTNHTVNTQCALWLDCPFWIPYKHGNPGLTTAGGGFAGTWMWLVAHVCLSFSPPLRPSPIEFNQPCHNVSQRCCQDCISWTRLRIDCGQNKRPVLMYINVY